MRDFCDAQLIKESEVFKKDPKALQLIMFEVANPLGAKAGIHKLGAIPCTCIASYIAVHIHACIISCRCLLLHFGKHSPNF